MLTMKKLLSVTIACCLAWLALDVVFASSVSEKIKIRQQSGNADSLKVWIFFTDKGGESVPLSKKAAISDRAMLRRGLRGSVSNSDLYDREVHPEYVARVKPYVLRIVHESLWLNAVSAYVRPASLQTIAAFDFVREIRGVAVYIREPEPVELEDTSRLGKEKSPFPPDYGPSYQQLNQIQVVDLHNRGLTGDGVTILILDSGFKLTHPVFAELRVDSTWDFINNNVNVEDPDDPSETNPNVSRRQQFHGTATLSIIGGHALGEVIGAAYNAQYLCAKTEVVATETQVEEDNWVAAIEWGERLGADIATSSVGYTDWYTYDSLDGNRAITSRAADAAAALGVIVVNAVGNGGRSSPYPTLNAPADGDSVIAAGAVSGSGLIVSFSSNGPTFDGRIKPDVCAMGTGNAIAVSSGGFGSGSGTSYSTPLVAGSIALLLEAHPTWDYGKVYQALTSTATRAANPDTVYGYGIVQALDANSVEFEDTVEVAGVVASPNPFKDRVDFAFTLNGSGTVVVGIYTVGGERVVRLSKDFSITQPETRHLSWDGRNDSGEEVASAVYIALISGPGVSATKKILKL